MTDDLLDDYIAAHIDAEPSALHSLWRRTHLRHVYPRMCSGHTQGRLLAMLAAIAQPRRVIELGTFTGYSALCLAENLPEDRENLEAVRTVPGAARPYRRTESLPKTRRSAMRGLLFRRYWMNSPVPMNIIWILAM